MNKRWASANGPVQRRKSSGASSIHLAIRSPLGFPRKETIPLEAMADPNEQSWKSVCPNYQFRYWNINAHGAQVGSKSRERASGYFSGEGPYIQEHRSSDCSVRSQLRWPKSLLTCLRYRSKCESLILQDFAFALSKDVENRLWNAHVKVNSRFRKQLSIVRVVYGESVGCS